MSITFVLFNKRYTARSASHNPDLQDYKLTHGMGEFGAHAEIAFERHLQKLREERERKTATI